MTISLSSVVAFLRNSGSLAAIIIGAAGTGGLPPAVRAVLVAIGGGLQWVEHYISAGVPVVEVHTHPAPVALQTPPVAPQAAARPAPAPTAPGTTG